MTAAQFTPRNYQDAIIDHIVQTPRCAVWASMGAGKTVSTFTALEALSHADSRAFPALVLAPTRVARSVWPQEREKWSHLLGLRVSPMVGGTGPRIKAAMAPADVYTVNYENLPWLAEHWGDRWPYRTVIADESTKLKSLRVSEQTSSTGKRFIRGQGGVRAKALAKIAHARGLERFVELTGTPSPNGLIDLWGQMWFLDGGQRLGRTFTGYTQRWFRPKRDGYGIEPLAHSQAEIERLLADICLTVDVRDYYDIAEPVVNNIYVDLPAGARTHYRELEKQMFTELAGGGVVDAVHAAALTIKCLQICQGFVYAGDADNRQVAHMHDEKIEALESIVEEAAGAPVLVAYQFVPDLERLKRAFPKGRELDHNPRTEAAWRAGEIPVMFAHPASAGHGLNLQDGGNILVYYGHWWNLEERLQVLERIGPVRQMQSGYDRPVFVHNILARDTVDEDVVARIDAKQSVQDALLAAMKRRGAA